MFGGGDWQLKALCMRAVESSNRRMSEYASGLVSAGAAATFEAAIRMTIEQIGALEAELLEKNLRKMTGVKFTVTCP